MMSMIVTETGSAEAASAETVGTALTFCQVLNENDKVQSNVVTGNVAGTETVRKTDHLNSVHIVTVTRTLSVKEGGGHGEMSGETDSPRRRTMKKKNPRKETKNQNQNKGAAKITRNHLFQKRKNILTRMPGGFVFMNCIVLTLQVLCFMKCCNTFLNYK